MLNASVAYKVAFALILWRAWLSIFIRTSFDPDEYWQGPEVAHRLVFGCDLGYISFLESAPKRIAIPLQLGLMCRYGHLTWEWAAGLRSYAHPLLFTPGLLLLRLLRLDSPAAVQLAPRATQAVLSLVHDAVLMAFVRSHLPTHLHLPTMLISCLSWFNCFTHSRPFSNSVESTLHLAVLAAWPRINRPATPTSALTAHPKTRRAWRAVAITLAGLCCVVRPPAAVLFLPVAALEILHAPSPTSTPAPTLSTRLLHAATYICDCVVLAALIVLSNGLMDRHFYGQWVFPAWVNLEFNVLQNSSADYGTHPPHWYFSQGIPAMLGSLLPLVVWGVWTSARHRRDDSCSSRHMPLWPFFLAVWGVAIHSVLPHKEFRYILPSFELILLYAAVPLLRPGAEESQAGPPQAGSTHPRAEPVDAHASAAQPAAHATGLRQRVAAQAVADVQPSEDHARRAGPRAAADEPWRKAIWAAAVSLQLPMLAYFGLVHQRGTIAVLEHLSRASIPPVRSQTPLGLSRANHVGGRPGPVHTCLLPTLRVQCVALVAAMALRFYPSECTGCDAVCWRGRSGTMLMWALCGSLLWQPWHLTSHLERL